MEKCPVPPNSRVDLKGVCSSGSIGKNISKDVKLDPGYNSKEQDPNWHYIFPSSIESTDARGNSEDGKTWVGPSANQLYKALERKGKGENVNPEDVKIVSAIHNVVTEITWAQIKEYESLHDCKNVTLTKFEGKWDQLSTKAKFLSLCGYEKPFDRHDWYINRCGKEVKYIIDYYGPTEKHGFHVDARPGSISGWKDRFHLFAKKVYASITR